MLMRDWGLMVSMIVKISNDALGVILFVYHFLLLKRAMKNLFLRCLLLETNNNIKMENKGKQGTERPGERSCCVEKI